MTAEQMAAKGAEYLQEEIKKRIAKKSIKFKMYAQIAEEGDNIEDPAEHGRASDEKFCWV